MVEFRQFIKQRMSLTIEHAIALLNHRLTDGLRQMTLSGTWWPANAPGVTAYLRQFAIFTLTLTLVSDCRISEAHGVELSGLITMHILLLAPVV